MDALVRHKKAEHGEGSLDGKSNTSHTMVKSISAPLTTMIPHASYYPNSTKVVKKIHKLDTLSRMAGKKSRSGNYYHSSGDESDDSIVGGSHYTTTTTTPATTAVAATQKSSLLSGSADYNRYRLAKAQLHYILRENEMLQDEYGLAQKKLKRMRTERRVLLHALMAKEKSRLDVEEEEDEEDTTSFEHIPNDH